MDFIIIFSMIIIFLLGFVFINKLSVIINPSEFDDNEYQQKPDMKTALIFGDIDIIDEISYILENYNISNTIINDINELVKSDSYNYLIALSASDFDNIMICSIGKKMMGIDNIIALCNISYYKKIYDDNNIKHLNLNNISASLVVSTLLQLNI